MAGFVNGTIVLDAYPFTTSAGSNHNVEVEGSLLFVTVSNNNDAITGIINCAVGGSLVLVVNVGPTNDLIIKHNNSGSAVGNRIATASGLDVTVKPFESALLGYDVQGGDWHVIKFAS